MAKETIELLVKAGAATAGPPLGPKLGPMGINTGKVVAAINTLTADMKGMDVPVKVIVNTETKEFELSIGTPPTAALIKKEIFIQRGSGSPKLEKAGDIPFDHIVSISRMKSTSVLASSPRAAAKEVVGSCQSMGILVDGKEPKEVIKEISEGKYDSKIKGDLQFLAEAAMKSRNQPYIEAAVAREKQKAEAKAAAASAGEKKETEAKPEK